MAVIRETFELVDRFSSGFRKVINMGSQASKTITNMGKASTSMSGVVNQRITSLTQSLSKQAKETSRLQKEYESLKQKSDVSKKALSGLQSQIEKSQKQEYSYSMAIAKTRQELEKAITQEKLHEAAIAKKEAAIRKAQEAAKRNNQKSGSGSSLSGVLNTVRNAAIVTGGIRLVKNIASASDMQSQLNTRIDMMNDGLQTTEELQRQIYQSAQASRGIYANTANMVGKFGTLAPSAFNSSAEIVSFAEQINKHFTLSGTSQAGVDAATLQLTQAMASGVLRGEELNSILEQTPTIAQAIAKYMGVNVGKMRNLASEGQITADVVKNALFATAQETNTKFENMPMTWAQLWRGGMNAVQQNLLPFLQTIAKGADFIHDNWSTISPILMGIATAAGVAAVGLGLQAASSWLATHSIAALTTALLTCPLTWIAVGIGIVVALIYRWIQSVGGIQVAWLIMQNAVLTAGDKLQIGIMSMVFGVQGFLDAMNYRFQSVGTNIANAMGDMRVNVLTQIEEMANGAIDILNDFISSVNKIPGVAISTIDQVRFAASAVAENTAQKAAREADLAALKAEHERKEASRSRQLESMKRQAAASEMERLAGIAGAQETARAAGESAEGANGSIPPYENPESVDVGTVGRVKNVESDIRLSDEDLKLYRDLAEQRYMNRIELQTLAPSINVTLPPGASGNLTADDVANKIRLMLIEQMAAGTSVSHAF